MEPKGVVTPTKNPQTNRSKSSILSKESLILSKKCENENPNHELKSPLSKSGSKLKKSGHKNQNPTENLPLLKNRMKERKFVVAKKSTRNDGLNQSKTGKLCSKCNKGNGKLNKCLCVAYESLRASQEEFFKNGGGFDVENGVDHVRGFDGDDKNSGLIRKAEIEEGCEEKVKGIIDENGNVPPVGDEDITEIGVTAIKRSRDRLLEEVRASVPEPGSGRVMNLVKAFENMKMVKSKGSEENDEKEVEDKGLKWEFPSLEGPSKPLETQSSSSSFCPSDLFLTSECLGLDSRRSSSLDSNRGLNSSESSGAFGRRQWRKRQQLKTTAKPFKLRTEERGKCKEEEFMKKLQQMKEVEEKLRVPIAQGLPWTTDEPECPAKPPIKEVTRPIDLVLHSDVRAEERAEFDHQVAEKMSFIEQYKMERERQRKLAEEEELRRLRKELVPKAQPMPYFDRPFIPRRSEKQPTIPKEPKFRLAQHKKIKCIQQSWSDTCSYVSSSDTYDGL
ncbi:non-motor microtubule binding protein [Lithospermum erythrorhizon]|uniref:Non-motor microtubule binding protein n=1 Tax=Lithospermum erythrorhizon TaxID=34254 RepID=A0AAV3PZ47_LITER